jgi:LysR family transcriptional regulator, mexEF-oprN operon transcriptional activator
LIVTGVECREHHLANAHHHFQLQYDMASSESLMSKTDLNLLIAFDTIMSERNLRIAGERLGRTQPAMSGIVARLRDHFGDRLFVRTPTGVVPTPRAEAIWSDIRDPLAAIASVMAPVSFDPAGFCGEVTIGLSDDFELLVLPRLLTHLRAEAPGIHVRAIEVDHRSATDRILDGTADVVLSALASESVKGVARADLFRMPFVVLYEHDSPAPDTLANYVARDHVGIAFSDGDRGFVDGARLEAGAGTLIAASPRFAAIPGLISATGGVATLPGPIALYLARSGSLATCPCPLPLPTVDVGVLWHERRRHDLANRWLREVVRETTLEIRSTIERR